MATCIENCLSNISTNPFCLESDQCQISKSLCRFVKPNLTSQIPFNWVCGGKISNTSKTVSQNYDDHGGEEYNKDLMWLKIQEEALFDVQQEPILKDYYYTSILSHVSLESALSNLLATKLSNSSLSKPTLLELFFSVLIEDREIRRAIRNDLKAVCERDPACLSHAHCLLNFKGFHASQAHRVAHKLWAQNRTALAVLIQSRVSEVFGVDIHPGARIGSGLVIDHATGVVIGETAVVGDNVTLLHNVTLGGTGKVSGDRHPKVGDGVFIGAGTKVLGSITIGDGARVGAGSVVLKEVPPNATAVGNPARLISR